MLKKLTAFFTATVMACATPLACNAEVIKHEVNVPPNILVLGDSIAAGYGLEGYSENRYSCASYANLLHDQYDAELKDAGGCKLCLLYTSPSPRDRTRSRMPSSA